MKIIGLANEELVESGSTLNCYICQPAYQVDVDLRSFAHRLNVTVLFFHKSDFIT